MAEVSIKFKLLSGQDILTLTFNQEHETDFKFIEDITDNIAYAFHTISNETQDSIARYLKLVFGVNNYSPSRENISQLIGTEIANHRDNSSIKIEIQIVLESHDPNVPEGIQRISKFYEKDAVLAAVAQHSDALQYAREELKADREVVLAAVARNGQALRFAAEALKADREVVLAAMATNGRELDYAAEALRADREVVLAAVAQDGNALHYAAETLRADREVVLAAVTRHGRALRFAAEALKADREVVLTAVAQDGLALRFAAETLRADREVVLAAVAQDSDFALRFAAAELQQERKSLKKMVEKDRSLILWCAAHGKTLSTPGDSLALSTNFAQVLQPPRP